MFIISPVRRYLKASLSIDDSIGWYSLGEIGLFFVDTAKDIVNTVTPYKHLGQRRKDATRLFSGIANVLIGLFFILKGLIISAVGLLIGVPFLILTSKSIVADIMTYSCGYFVLIFIGGLVQTGRGLFQIISSPIALIQISWRSLLTAILPTKTFQGRASVKRLVAEVDALLESNQNAPETPSEHTIQQILIPIHQLIQKYESIAKKGMPEIPQIRDFYQNSNQTNMPKNTTQSPISPKLTESIDPSSTPSSADQVNLGFFSWLDSLRENNSSKEPIALQYAYYMESDGKNLPDKNTCLKRAIDLGHAGNAEFLQNNYGASAQDPSPPF